MVSVFVCVCACKCVKTETRPQPRSSYFLVVRIWSEAASKSGRSCCFRLSSGNREAAQNMLRSNYRVELFEIKSSGETFVSWTDALAVSVKMKCNQSIRLLVGLAES